MAQAGQEPRGKEQRSIGYAVGAFDLFHIGHLNLIKQAREHCDELIIGVVSDDVLERTKGARPVIPEYERLEIVKNLSIVDRAVLEANEDRLQTWEELGFTVFFKGDDWKGTAKGRELERRFAEVGVQVQYFPYTVHTSSSLLRRALQALDSASAQEAEAASH